MTPRLVKLAPPVPKRIRPKEKLKPLAVRLLAAGLAAANGPRPVLR